MLYIDQKMKTVVIDGKRTTLEDLKKMHIPLSPTGPSVGRTHSNGLVPNLTLQDVAELKVVKKSESISRTDGKAVDRNSDRKECGCQYG